MTRRIEEAAKGYVYSKQQATTDSLGYAMAFVAGVEWFINHRLPELLAIARSGQGTIDYNYTIQQILNKVKNESI